MIDDKETMMTDTIDTTKPNAGRIYDYLLGGSHNFEADRQAAEQILQLAPSARNAARLNRWFLHAIVTQFAASGLQGYLDLATGLPTEGYIHDLVPPSVPLLYNDRDPVTVQYGRSLVASLPNVTYIQADIGTDVERILAAATDRFGDNRRVGILCIGVAYFLDDDQLRTLLTSLYDWCARGSQMALSWLFFNPEHPEYQAGVRLYERMGTPLYSRSPAQIAALLHPWTLDPPGTVPVTTWVDAATAAETPDWRMPTDSFEGYGTVIHKPV